MKTPKLNFAVLCDDAFTSEGSKKLNIVGIFQRIFAAKLPIVHPRLAVVANFNIEERDKMYNFKVQMVKEKEEANVLMEAAGIADVKAISASSEENWQMIIYFQIIKFDSLGKYFFKVLLDDMPVAKIPFEVVPPLT